MQWVDFETCRCKIFLFHGPDRYHDNRAASMQRDLNAFSRSLNFPASLISRETLKLSYRKAWCEKFERRTKVSDKERPLTKPG